MHIALYNHTVYYAVIILQLISLPAIAVKAIADNAHSKE
jgi:hypothetical protein